MATHEAPKRCPKCGEDTIRSIDTYIGTCDHYLGEPQGYTEICWDSCECIGYDCSECGWEYMFTKEDDATAERNTP